MMTRAPVITVPTVIVRSVAVIVHVIVVVNVDRRTAPVVIAVIVRVAVIWMSVVAVVIHMQVIRRPANGERGGHAPEETGVKWITGGVRVVIDGVRARVVVINRLR